MTNTIDWARRGARARAAMLLPLIALAACDFSVSNPGRVADDLLDLPGAVPPVVNGTERGLAEALNFVAYTGGAVSREINAAGSLNQCGISIAQREGRLLSDEVDAQWNFSQRARFLAEDGVRRLEGVLGAGFESDTMSVKQLLWVGYTNRLLGENMCDAVIDGGAKQPNAVYFQRSEAAFTRALDIAGRINNARLQNAARAGRASVRVYLNNWDGAEADARAVPETFVFQLSFYDTAEAERNRLFWCNGNQPYRAHTVSGTFYEEYHRQTRDPRVSWQADPRFPVGDVGQITWLPQTKYASRTAPIRLSSGREMKLIIAESELRRGNWQVALGLVNSLRTTVGVQPWQAASSVEAWGHLKRERGIELWLEGRRLGDLRRWAQGNTPGASENLAGRDLCFPVGLTEIETNDNID